MKNWIDLSIMFGGMVITGFSGYLLGRYQFDLVNKIRTLENASVKEPEPIVTMGAYEKPRDIGETNTPVGLVESKTPQRLEWENEIAVEKEGLGPVGSRG